MKTVWYTKATVYGRVLHNTAASQLEALRYAQKVGTAYPGTVITTIKLKGKI